MVLCWFTNSHALPPARPADGIALKFVAAIPVYPVGASHLGALHLNALRLPCRRGRNFRMQFSSCGVDFSECVCYDFAGKGLRPCLATVAQPMKVSPLGTLDSRIPWRTASNDRGTGHNPYIRPEPDSPSFCHPLPASRESESVGVPFPLDGSIIPCIQYIVYWRSQQKYTVFIVYMY